MFWKVLSGLARGSFLVQRSVTAIGVATIISVGVYDFLKNRQNKR